MGKTLLFTAIPFTATAAHFDPPCSAGSLILRFILIYSILPEFFPVKSLSGIFQPCPGEVTVHFVHSNKCTQNRLNTVPIHTLCGSLTFHPVPGTVRRYRDGNTGPGLRSLGNGTRYPLAHAYSAGMSSLPFLVFAACTLRESAMTCRARFWGYG